ncbi:putative permease [uncultured archaeon]|nr:putative permease [uncultured archaeon]
MDLFYPVQIFVNWLVYSIFSLKQVSILGEAINFFIYDSIKIFILLAVIIFIVSYIRTYLAPEKVKKILSKKFEIFGNMTASTIGIFTPFCSCSAVPLFIGFVESGVPLGVTFSYLIAAPLINEVAAALLWGLFGWKVALLYIASGWIISVFAGFILGKMHLEKYVEDYVYKIKIKKNLKLEKKTQKERAKEAYQEVKSIIRRVFPYVLIGIAIGAFIHGYAPENLLTKIAGKGNWFAVPIAVLIGVPLYSNAAGIIPIISSLIEKGLPLGTALAFMMAVVALSLPEIIILRKVLKIRLLIIYVAIVTAGIIFTGYLFNWIL